MFLIRLSAILILISFKGVNQVSIPGNNQENKKCGITTLEGTKWTFEVVDGIMDYIRFEAKDSVIVYSCELDEKVFGVYRIENDTIFIQTIRGQYDNEFPEGSRHRHKKINYQLLYKSDSICSPVNTLIKYYKSVK